MTLDLDATKLDPHGMRITLPDGREFEFHVPPTFRGMNPNELRELYRERVAMDGVADLDEAWTYEQGADA